VSSVSVLNQAGALVGKDYEDFAIQQVGGATGRLSDYVGKGKPIVLDFYTTW